jgi:hypothetical protein
VVAGVKAVAITEHGLQGFQRQKKNNYSAQYTALCSPPGIEINYTKPHLNKIALYPSYFRLWGCWLRKLTPVTYSSKLLGILFLAAYPQLELFRV